MRAVRSRILVVEDDPAIRTALQEKLTLEGYEITAVADGERAQDRLAGGNVDLLVLDLMLPGLDGISLLHWLRRRDRALPVLILSARDREADKVAGLKIGADDYLTKPFGLDELMARIQALLRRAYGPGRPVRIGDVVYDPARRCAERDGREVVLSRKELELLDFLVRHRGRVVTREEILDAVWGPDAVSEDRVVDYHVLHLRRKLEPDAGKPRYLVTRHGLGYQLVE